MTANITRREPHARAAFAPRDSLGMNASTQSTTSVLESLIETVRDSQEFFLSAAEDVKNPAFKTMFRELATERQEFAGELQLLAADLGGETHVTSTVGGAIHRGWMDIKAALASGDERTVLTECERGEDYTVSEYRDALAGAVFSPRMRKVIHSQFNLIHASHERMRRLRNLLKA
jgi:uncharacterized protein (TIGR02284 family)